MIVEGLVALGFLIFGTLTIFLYVEYRRTCRKIDEARFEIERMLREYGPIDEGYRPGIRHWPDR